jgi:hypothetical protein
MPTSTRVRDMGTSDVIQRAAEARSYLEVARMLVESTEPADWKTAGSNAVLCGIAACDAICGAVLKQRSASENHGEAKKLLDWATSPQTSAGAHFKKLTDEKTNFQYSSTRVTQSQAQRLVTAAELDRMEDALRS